VDPVGDLALLLSLNLVIVGASGGAGHPLLDFFSFQTCSFHLINRANSEVIDSIVTFTLFSFIPLMALVMSNSVTLLTSLLVEPDLGDILCRLVIWEKHVFFHSFSIEDPGSSRHIELLHVRLREVHHAELDGSNYRQILLGRFIPGELRVNPCESSPFQ